METKTWFEEQWQTLFRIAGPAFRQEEPDDETLKVFARVLWTDRTKNENSTFHLNSVTLKENTIPGYLAVVQYQSMLGTWPEIQFQVDSSQFEQEIDIQPSIPNSKSATIYVSIHCCERAEESLIQLFRRMCSSNMFFVDRLRYYQLPHARSLSCFLRP